MRLKFLLKHLVANKSLQNTLWLLLRKEILNFSNFLIKRNFVL